MITGPDEVILTSAEFEKYEQVAETAKELAKQWGERRIVLTVTLAKLSRQVRELEGREREVRDGH